MLGSFSEKREYTVFYIGTREGQVYKVAQWNNNGQLKSNLLDIFQVHTSSRYSMERGHVKN